MGLFKSLKRLFGQKENPKDIAVNKVLEKWQRGQKKFEKATMEVLEQQLKETTGEPIMMILAAYEIAKRGNIEFLSTFIHGNVNQAIAVVEGLCYAGCNGNDSAIEMTSGAINHSDPSVRLRLVKSLMMIADGTPGDCGFSTTQGRERARAIIKLVANDNNSEVHRWSDYALRETEAVHDIRRGTDTLTYLGRRLAETLLESVDPSYG